MILTVPPVFRHIASPRLRKGTPAVARRAIRAVTRQKQYIAFRASSEETKEFLSSDLSRSIFQMRASELFLYTAAVANMTINGNDPTWFEKVIEALAEHTKEPEQHVRERWLDTCYFAETLRYVHLGVPEHIFVVPD